MIETLMPANQDVLQDIIDRSGARVVHPLRSSRLKGFDPWETLPSQAELRKAANEATRRERKEINRINNVKYRDKKRAAK